MQARETIENGVRREFVGPIDRHERRGQPLTVTAGLVSFDSVEAARELWHDSDSGEEILTGTDPLRRYGVGILHPRNTGSDDPLRGVVGLSTTDSAPQSPTGLDASEGPDIFAFGTSDEDDFDLSAANTYAPSAMALSFRVNLRSGALMVLFRGAYYDPITVHVLGLAQPWTWWVRRPFEIQIEVSAESILQTAGKIVELRTPTSVTSRVAPKLRLFARSTSTDNDALSFLVTVVAENPSSRKGPRDALFQCGIEVRPVGDLSVVAYSEDAIDISDQEKRSLDLLYRNKRTFAIGHGCAADWATSAGNVSMVSTSSMPGFEVPSLTPDVFVLDELGRPVPLVVSMRELSLGGTIGNSQIESVLSAYEAWIQDRKREVASLPAQHQEAADEHVKSCTLALARMRNGWATVLEGGVAADAFRIMNAAMLEQQVRSRLRLREATLDKRGQVNIAGTQPVLDLTDPAHGRWRPFQIGFILATLPELVDRAAPLRDHVDLIFFPTGGGKTEAYLGAAAMSLIARRLNNPNDSGTDIVMRYTLRLLTAQQFLRAASLMCVIEDMRSRDNRLGIDEISVGVWLGGESTPNTWKQAVDALRKLEQDAHSPNKFLLLRCPWCGAQMGPIARSGGSVAVGYIVVGKQVALRCPDTSCRFGGRKALPVHVVDEDIYESRPSLVIGTVDKFAMLAWRPAASRIFGLTQKGQRDVSPPGLIIQDELHLISGPLGSMVGLYEPSIERLMTDSRCDPPVMPKIIASTATIRGYEAQVKALYGRTQVALFPPHGLIENSSFFAEVALNTDGTQAPGRRYVGVFSPSLGSTQSVQVRVSAATLQAARELPESERDGYWTNLNFFNSLRELGNTVSLLQSDIPDYLLAMRNRERLTSADVRWPRNTLELTGRRRSDEIPKAIEQLQVSYPDPRAVGVCLASNIIEVGIDIDRLGLMTIVGQPKTTAQYIQVSGRVGRRADVSPGLVLTILGASKPRDRSHYERFRSYHQALYAAVEPTSVTPFAEPVLRRALHASLITQIRISNPDLPVFPFPEAEFEEAVAFLRKRVDLVDPLELPRFERRQVALANQWRAWERTAWSASAFDPTGDTKQGLMRSAGALPTADALTLTWDVPMSMRNVDAECRLSISTEYAREDGAKGDLK